jgi:polar amino acid transport system substrate-binding protein
MPAKLYCLLIVCTFALASCASYVKPSSKTSTLYDTVVSSGKLRCGYTIDPPGCLKNPNTGELSGIGIETIQLLGKHLGLKVEWTEEVDWGTMIEGLETGRYDIIATPIWPNAERARVIDFSKPLYFSPIWAYCKASNKRLMASRLSDLNSSTYTIASIDGATPQVIAREDFPKAHLVSLPQQSQIASQLLSISTGKADFTFVEAAVAVAFNKQNPGTITKIATDTPVRIFPNCWAFRRGQMEFKAMLDTVLDQLINSGSVDKLVSRYEPAANTLSRVALPYRTATK